MEEAKWYVVHTYSGYENKVKANIEKTIENNPHLAEQILEVRVPLQDVVEVKNGKQTVVQKKMFPGYVLLNMDMNDDTWYVVRNTRGVTGFVGNGRNPVALREDEVVSMLTPVIQADAAATAKAAGKPVEGAEPVTISPFEVGDSVTLISEPWAGMPATVSEIDPANQRLTVLMTLVGQETPVELSFTQVRKED